MDGALIDSYTVGSRMELFKEGGLRMSKMIDYPSAYGVVMSGNARKLQICFREFLKEERASVFEIITNNVQGVTVIKINSRAWEYYLLTSFFKEFRTVYTYIELII